MRWFFVMMREITRVYYSLMYKIKFEGIENIPKDGGYIIACNHLFYFDPILLSLRVSDTIFYLGKAELFDLPLVGWAFHAIGGIKVSRGAGDTSTMDKCVELSKENKIIGVFPEGTRSKDGNPGRPKSGMSVIAKMTEYDILPCAIKSSGPLKFRSEITVCYGEVIKATELGLEDESPRALKRATKYVWAKILTLAGVEQDDEK